MIRSSLFSISVLLAAVLPSVASAVDKEIVASFIAYDPPVVVDSIGAVNIELRGLWGSPNDLPDAFAFSDADLVAARIGYRQAKHIPADAFVLKDVEEWYAKDAAGLRRINPFMAPNGTTGLFAFQVTIRNGGSTPVRLDPAALTLSTGNAREAIPPVPDLAFYDRWILAEEVSMDRRKGGPLALIQTGWTIRHVPYPVGIAGAMLAQRVPSCCGVGVLGRTLPPGTEATGYLLFPVEWGADSVVVSVRFDGALGESAIGLRRCDHPCRWDRATSSWVRVGTGDR